MGVKERRMEEMVIEANTALSRAGTARGWRRMRNRPHRIHSGSSSVGDGVPIPLALAEHASVQGRAARWGD